MGYFDVATARFSGPDAFFGNPHPIALADGIFRCRGRPSFRRHVRLILRKRRIHLAPSDHFRPSGKADAGNFGWDRQISPFLGKFGDSIYRDWDILMSRPPEFPTPCAIFLANPDPIAFATGGISMSGPLECPTPRAIFFREIRTL